MLNFEIWVRESDFPAVTTKCLNCNVSEQLFGNIRS